MNMSEEVTIKIKKENLWKYSTFILLAVVVIGIIVMVAGGNGNTNTQTQVDTGQQQADSISVDFEQVIESNTPVAGKSDAPITILEFSDFSCPYCAAASGDNAQYTAYMQSNQPGWEPPVSNILKDYVATGKVRFATFYTMGHSGGRPAQIVAWCINDQNSELYWKFYSQAFAHLEDVEDAAKMRTLAQGISGVNMKSLDACISSGKHDSRFNEEQGKGAQLGMSGTPGFIVGKSDGSEPAVVIRGAYPYSTFQQAIEANL
jgi:protein-disulfide isomerase